MKKIESIEHFLSLTTKELDEIFASGTPVTWDMLEGKTFYGANHLKITKLLTINKFQKVFKIIDGKQSGYNIRIKSNNDYSNYTPILKNGKPIEHGFFGVVTENNNCLLDYSLGKNPVYDPSKLLRDVLIKKDGIILGKAYVFSMFLTYFILTYNFNNLNE